MFTVYLKYGITNQLYFNCLFRNNLLLSINFKKRNISIPVGPLFFTFFSKQYSNDYNDYEKTHTDTL